MALYIKLHLASNNRKIAVNTDVIESIIPYKNGSKILSTNTIESGFVVKEKPEDIINMLGTSIVHSRGL